MREPFRFTLQRRKTKKTGGFIGIHQPLRVCRA